jgi:uncharacterized protein YecE (DUF72 family)
MRLHTGTSGYAYKEWRPAFYPEEVKERDMLAYYGARLSTVEINNTFYRLPNRTTLARWAEQVPADFVFVLKASRRITHIGRLLPERCREALDFLWTTSAELGARRGPILFQLPPNFRKDLDRLAAFVAILPTGLRAAFEFRHASWFDDETYAALRAAGAALCVAETDEDDPATAALTPTADWGYLRLRREDYGEAELAVWAARLRAQPWREAFVFFKHEDTANAPRLAAQFRALFGG